MSANSRGRVLSCLVLLGINLFIFIPAFTGDFIWDDLDIVSQNAFLQSPEFPIKNWFSPYSGPMGTEKHKDSLLRSPLYYRPFTMFSFWLDLKVWGLNPAGFHLTNLLLHILNTCLVFILIVEISRDLLVAFFSALLFAVFPIHFESVSWISGRTDLLSFFLLGLAAFLYFRFRDRPHSVCSFLSGFFFFLSLLAKENGLLLPLLLLFYLYTQRKKIKNWILASIPYGIAFFLWLLMRQLALGIPRIPGSGFPAMGALAALGFYVKSFLFPFGLNLTIDAFSVLTNSMFFVLGIILCLGFIFVFFFFIKKREKYFCLTFFYLSLFLSMIPVLLIMFTAAAISPMAWRLLYLPSFFFLTGFVFGCKKLFKDKRKICLSVIGILLAVFYIREIIPLNRHYGKDETSFWLGLPSIDKQSPLARINIGSFLLGKNQELAMKVYEKILERKNDPQYFFWASSIYENLASYFAGKREYSRAEFYFGKLIKLGPGLPLSAELKYAFFLIISGKKNEGKLRINALLDDWPDNHQVLLYAAQAYIVLGEMEKARRLLLKDYTLFQQHTTRAVLEKMEPSIH